MDLMLLARVVEASQGVAATRSRKAKVTTLAGCLQEAGPDEIAIVASWLAGSLRQRRTGVGWRSLNALPEPSATPSLTVERVDQAFEAMAGLGGSGSANARVSALKDLFARATVDEQAWLRGAITGEVRQGALDALVQEAIAQATEVPLGVVRRAAMLSGSTPGIASIAFTEGAVGLESVGLTVGRPVQPMLASSAPDIAAALEKAGPGEVAIDAKLDGIRIQVHRNGDEVLIATRSLDDITARLPDIVDLARSFYSDRFVLDGEALTVDDAGRPRAFQDTASRTASAGGAHVSAYFFDILHLDGMDLIDQPASVRASGPRAIGPP